MSPRRIHFPTGAAGCARHASVLIEWNTDDDLVFSDPDKFFTRSLHVWNVLQDFRAEDAIERIVGKVKLGYVSRDRHYSGELKIRLMEI